MNTTQAGEEELKSPEVLKTDVLGRVKTSAARREQVLGEFERSGLSGQKFAVTKREKGRRKGKREKGKGSALPICYRFFWRRIFAILRRRVRPEWPLVKPQFLLTEALAPNRAGDVLQRVFGRELLQLREYVPHLALIANGLLEPGKLLPLRATVTVLAPTRLDHR
jgi:hypothetical protein